jgi:uncharacterized protein YndB with AHSA1/START domain
VELSTTTDRIEKEMLLRAPLARVWRAISTADEFGTWFGMDFGGQAFAVGESVSGKILYPGYEHLRCEMAVERIEPQRLFAYRWHPYAIDPAIDYSSEPMTLVEFQLDEVAEGTRLRIVESGFDQIPAGRRAEAFRMNSGGWDMQMKDIEKHVTAP